MWLGGEIVEQVSRPRDSLFLPRLFFVPFASGLVDGNAGHELIAFARPRLQHDPCHGPYFAQTSMPVSYVRGGIENDVDGRKCGFLNDLFTKGVKFLCHLVNNSCARPLLLLL